MEALSQLINNDLTRGFALILPLNTVHQIEGILISPLGCQDQLTINECGEFITKNDWPTNRSQAHVNLRVINEQLPLCKYGHCLKRIVNYIIGIWLQHPSTPIFLSKLDFDVAYRRCHLDATSALESCCIFNNFLLVALCLTFGGTPCPNFWEACREPFCDLANKLIHNSQRDHMTTFDPMSLPLLGPNRLPPDTPHAPALPLAIPVPPDNFGKGDIYIDDSIFVTPNITKPSNVLQKLFPLPSTPLQDHYPKMNHYLGKC